MRELIRQGDSVIVSDIDEGKIILRTEVSFYKAEREVIFVPSMGQSERFQKDSKYHIKVILDGNPVEYDATIRNIAKKEIEFALYNKKIGYKRAFERHSIQAEGFVLAISIGSVQLKLCRSIPVEILDISGGGILLRAHRNEFQIGSILRVQIELPTTNKIVSEFKIVRSQNATESQEEYGCKNMAVKGEEDCSMENAETREYEAVLEQDKSFLEKYWKKLLLVERKIGYIRLLEMYQDEMVSDQKLARNIVEFIESLSAEKISNIIHKVSPEEEKEVRRKINVAILNGIIAMKLHRKEEEVKYIVKYALARKESLKMNPACELITSVSEEYERITSMPQNGYAMMPLAYLEQLYFVQKEEMVETKTYFQYLLAEYFKVQLREKEVLLMNGKRARICGLYASDISHPVLYVDGKLEQLKNPSGIVGAL